MIGIEPEQPRPRIAGLRQWRDGADFDEAEADTQQRIGHLGVLVEACGDADRIGEIEPEHAQRQPLVVARRRRQRREFQHFDCDTVGVFRVERAQERPGQAIEKADHGFGSGKTRRPSTSSGSGRAQRTADSGSGA